MSAINRRSLLLMGAAAAIADVSPAGAQAAGLELGAPQAFSFDAVIARARAQAGRAYQAPPSPAPEILEQIDYDAHGKIKFKPELGLFAADQKASGGRANDITKGKFAATFFHLGRYFKKPQRIHVVEGGQAREIIYREDYFDMPRDSVAHKLPKGAGFAGFRFQEANASGGAAPTKGWKDKDLPWQGNDWVAFLGASYFRAIGDEFQYGLSARGLMLDAAIGGKAEEFPDFTHVWLERGQGDSVVAYCLLDSPSVAGAFRFVMTRGKGVTMEIDTQLFVRKEVDRFGVAPLTSMFWYSETIKPTAVDWRPEVHDSDGLAIWTGSGERIWRPLNNPRRTVASSFGDENPRGFGLLQRDRLFDHYQDGVFYERRPSLWVEPLGQWGRGAVQLIEIPTDDEIHDNIVAAWIPAENPKAGASLKFAYRLHWQADEPNPTALARVVATRLGNGGQPGTTRPQGVRKFMIEFKGGPLENIPFGVKPEAVLWASRGTFSYVFTEAVPNDVPGHWRAQFDLAADGADPVEMRCFLKAGDKVLTETWLYQYWTG
jgi:periplasmic glucans biosynthesis protein